MRRRSASLYTGQNLNRLINLNTRAGRLGVFSLMYLSEGIPVGFSTVALAAFLRQQGTSLVDVGALVAAVYAPWGFKWAWAPLVDLIRIRRLGPSRAWILFAQAMMILTMAVLLGFNLTENVGLLTTLIIVHNVFAATQDVAIDALAVRVLPEDEVGTANGAMFASQFLGIGVGGSGALYISGMLGFQSSFFFVLALMLLIFFFVTVPLKEPPDPEPTPEQAGALQIGVWQAFTERIGIFFRELRIGFFDSGIGPLAGVVFSILPPAATALGLALLTTIQVDMQQSEATIASIALASNVAGALGSLFGGWISDKTGRPRTCIAIFYAATSLPTLYLASRFLTHATSPPESVAGLTLTVFAVCVTFYNLFYGMQQGVVTAVFMRITNPAVAATQFTGYMALHNLALTYSSLWQGRAAESFGYSTTLRIDAALAFVALTVLPIVISQRKKSKPRLEPAAVGAKVD